MPRKIIAVVDDLFFASKIRGTAEQVGVAIAFPRKSEDLIRDASANPPALIICDLNAQRINPLELATQLKADEQLKSIPLLGFFSHVQTDLQRDAKQAGFDEVLPRSAFTKNLVAILRGEI